MFCINKDIELNEKLLYKMFNSFYVGNLPRLEKYKNYYDGIQKILQKTYADDTKPCSRTVVNYVKNICDIYCGYMGAPGYISYDSEQDITEIMDILRYNDYQDEDSDLLLDALIYGVAAELMYIDNEGKTRFKLINPKQCFGIYDNSLTNDLLYFVRWYKANEWDDSSRYILDVYSDNLIKHYTMDGLSGSITYINEEPHFFGQCPANIFMLPDEKSIFDCIIGLQDTANELLNTEVDDFGAFVDAFLVLTNTDFDKDDVKAMKEARVLALPDGATANWLTKNANDTQVEDMLKRIQEAIYRIACCPDLSSETFVGGVSSGIAIKYRLTGIETRAAKIEGAMKKALQRRIEIICGIASLKLGEEVFRDIKINFKRNIPEDLTSYASVISSLSGLVSDKTLLSQIPFIQDVNAEIEAIQKQKQANMELYSFSPVSEDDEDEKDK